MMPATFPTAGGVTFRSSSAIYDRPGTLEGRTLMELGLSLILIGVVVAVFISYPLGVVILVIGIVLLLLPYLRR
jgi:hypothetical protein